MQTEIFRRDGKNCWNFDENTNIDEQRMHVQFILLECRAFLRIDVFTPPDLIIVRKSNNYTGRGVTGIVFTRRPPAADISAN